MSDPRSFSDILPGDREAALSAVDELRIAGKFDSEGEFTLDPAKAREKLKKFQFPEPDSFAVHLVAAAIAGGARKVTVDSSAGKCVIQFDGFPLTREDLENLTTSLFVGSHLPQWTRLRELAIGVNAALGTHPTVEVETNTGWRCRFKPNANENIEATMPIANGIRILAREAPVKAVSRFFSRSHKPECKLVEAHCSLSGVPILVNGKPINESVKLSDAVAVLRLRGEPALPNIQGAEPIWTHERPVVGFSAWLLLHANEAHTLHAIVNGVTYRTTWPEPLAAVVAVTHLPRDLSYRNIVRESKEFEALVEQLKECRAYLQREICRAWASCELSVEQRRFFAVWIERWLRASKKDRSDPGLTAVTELPYFVRAGSNELVSLATLQSSMERDRNQRVLITERNWDVPPIGPEIVVLVQGAVKSTLTGLFGSLRSGDDIMEAAVAAHQNRQYFEAQPQQHPVLPAASLGIQAVKLPGWTGELGWVPKADEERVPPATLRLLKTGRPLGSRSYTWQEGLPAGLIGVLEHPDLLPNREWNDVLLRQSALLELPQALVPALIKLSAALSPDQPWKRQALIQTLAVLKEQAPRDLRETPLFTVHLPDAPLATFQQLREQCQRLGHLPTTDRNWSLPPLNRALVVLMRPWLRPLLSELFGSYQDYEPELRDAARSASEQRRWLQTSPQKAQLQPTVAYWARATLDGGEIGIPVGPLAARTRVDFYRQGRPLGHRVVDHRIGLPPGLQVAIVDEESPVDLDWTRILEGPHDQGWVQRVKDGFPSLLEAMAVSFPPQPPQREHAQQILFRILALTPPDRIPESILAAHCLNGRDGRTASLDTIIEQDGAVDVLVQSEPPRDWPDHEYTLWLSPSAYNELTNWMGPTPFCLRNADYQAWVQHQALLTREPQPAELDGKLFWRAWINEPTYRGEIGLGESLLFKAAGSGSQVRCPPLHIDFEILYHERPVARMSLPLGPLGQTPMTTYGTWRCRAIVDCSELSFDGSAVRRDAAWDSLTDSLRERARLVGFTEAYRLSELPSQDREQLLAYLWRQLAWEATRGITPLQLQAPVFPLGDGSWASLEELRRLPRVCYVLGEKNATVTSAVLVRRELLSLFRVIFGLAQIVEEGSVPSLEAHRPLEIRLERSAEARYQPGQDFYLQRELPTQVVPQAYGEAALRQVELLLQPLVPEVKLAWQSRIERLSIYNIGMKTVVQLNPNHSDWAPLTSEASRIELIWSLVKILPHLPVDPGEPARMRHAQLLEIIRTLEAPEPEQNRRA